MSISTTITLETLKLLKHFNSSVGHTWDGSTLALELSPEKARDIICLKTQDLRGSTLLNLTHIYKYKHIYIRVYTLPSLGQFRDANKPVFDAKSPLQFCGLLFKCMRHGNSISWKINRNQ